MNLESIKRQKLRLEKSKQYSNNIKTNLIFELKNTNYYTVDVPLDGDAPKEYIKAYFYHKNCPRKSNPAKWHGFYAKFGGKSYPHESITEFGINKIGEALGLKMNTTYLVIANKQIRFLSQDFINNKRKKLIHGVEILHEYYEDKAFIDEINRDKKVRREFLTFTEIEKAITHVHPKQSEYILGELIKLITFDAIVGNNDRHFYNWGVIGNILNQSNKKIEFSPIYDTARGLLWNVTEDKIKQKYKQVICGSNELESFIKKSKPRFSFEENPTANHFELIEYLINYKEIYRKIVSPLLTVENEKNAYLALKNTIFRYFSKERNFLILKILELRFKKLRCYL